MTTKQLKSVSDWLDKIEFEEGIEGVIYVGGYNITDDYDLPAPYKAAYKALVSAFYDFGAHHDDLVDANDK